MIRINLLPQQTTGRASAAPRAASSGGGIIVALILLVLFGVVGAAGFLVFSQVSASNKAVSDREKTNNDLKRELASKRDEFEEVTKMLAVLENQLVVLQALDPEQRLFWSQKLNILPLYVPQGVYLSNLLLEENVAEVELPESKRRYKEWNDGGKKGDPPRRTYRPVITQTLTMTGISYIPEGGDTARLQRALDFIAALKSKEVKQPWNNETVQFMNFFRPDIEPSPMETISVDGRECTQFSIKMTTRDMTSELDASRGDVEAEEEVEERPAARRSRRATADEE